MALSQLKTVNLGKTRTGLVGTIGYTLLNSDGTVNSARATGGVYELTAGSGMYASFVSFPDDFSGSIFWDSGQVGASLVFATEQYNYLENNPNVDLTLTQSLATPGLVWDEQQLDHVTAGSFGNAVNEIGFDVAFIKSIEGGRWLIDTSLNQMIFYKNDNVTEVARFNLYDATGSATSDCVYERVRV